MSIVLIDDVLFNDKGEQRAIRYNNCIFFLVLNGISIFSGLFYLYFYFKIPYYQNSSNSLSLFLNIFHLISNSFYFLIFFEFYLYEPTILSLTIKIITMFNPLVILCIYYWSACLTHNLYVTYYNYTHNMDKRIKFYKYLLFLIMVVFYLYTLFNIHYNESQLLSKSFSFISNYNISFLDFFYISGLVIIIYISIKLYYVINKKEDFITVNEYQENEERNEKIKNLFNSVIARNISFICYFLITFTPTNIIMILKYFLGKSNIKCYFIDYVVIMLISFNGTFLFLVRLFDPLMRNFIINLLTFNREFISTYKEYLLKEKRLNESLTEEVSYNAHDDTINESLSDIKTKIIDFPENYDDDKNKMYKKLYAKSFGKIKSEQNMIKIEPKHNKKINYSSIFTKKASSNKNIEMNSFISNSKNYSNLNKNDEDYYAENKTSDNYKDNRDNSSNLRSYRSIKSSKSVISSGMNSLNSINKESLNEKDDDSDKKENIINMKRFNVRDDSDYSSKTKSYLHANSNENIEKENVNNNKTNFGRIRSNTICLTKTSNQDLVNRANKFSNRNKTSLFIKSFRKNKNNNTPNKNLSNTRANSSTSHFFQRKFLPPGVQKRRSSSKTKEEFYHEEISSFALMNYHLELNENLLRMIAISISINECRIYDDIKEYKKYYTLTIPWENKDLYKQTTLFKEYNDETIPSWIGLKNDGRFTNIQFKIMSYCPFVFHHIRLIDHISIDDMLSSLDPLVNIKKIMKVSGGRGNNSLISTWDKKIIVKTIDENERQILIDKMIIDFHCMMKEERSILSRIYGVFKIELRDKGSINVIIQRNMNDLPLNTRILTFDFKGSTVDRQTISKHDVSLEKEQLINKYKNKVLKDIDLGIIGMKFELDSDDLQKISNIIDSDSSFLQNAEITDYSLVVFIHKYRIEDIVHNKWGSRIFASKDKKYIFNFTIVDFLGTFNFEKKGEKLAKSLVGYIKKLKDTNFSVLDPERYAKRFRKFCKKIIVDG